MVYNGLRVLAEKLSLMNDRFQHQSYLIRKRIFKLLGESFHVFDPQGRLVFYSHQKAFRLKEDIRIYTGEDKKNEVLVIKARNIIDFSAAYDVMDSITGEKVGVLKRRGFRSMLRDEWIIMDSHEREIGNIQEDNLVLALIRRFLIGLIPQSYAGIINGHEVCSFRQNFNPFVMKITVDFSQDFNGLMDKRLGIAAAILLCAIEGKQD